MYRHNLDDETPGAVQQSHQLVREWLPEHATRRRCAAELPSVDPALDAHLARSARYARAS